MVTTIISGAYNNIITPSTISAFNMLKIYLFWTIMHNVSNYLYQEFCITKTWYGRLFSPIRSQNPECKFLQWAFNTSSSAFTSMISLVATWGITNINYMFSIKKNSS
jgi:hypothetical protein